MDFFSRKTENQESIQRENDLLEVEFDDLIQNRPKTTEVGSRITSKDKDAPSIADKGFLTHQGFFDNNLKQHNAEETPKNLLSSINLGEEDELLKPSNDQSLRRSRRNKINLVQSLPPKPSPIVPDNGDFLFSKQPNSNTNAAAKDSKGPSSNKEKDTNSAKKVDTNFDFDISAIEHPTGAQNIQTGNAEINYKEKYEKLVKQKIQLKNDLKNEQEKNAKESDALKIKMVDSENFFQKQLRDKEKDVKDVREELESYYKKQIEIIQKQAKDDLLSREKHFEYEITRLKEIHEREKASFKRELELKSSLEHQVEKLSNQLKDIDLQKKVDNEVDTMQAIKLMDQRENNLKLLEAKIEFEKKSLDNERLQINKKIEEFSKNELALKEQLKNETEFLSKEKERMHSEIDRIRMEESSKKGDLMVEQAKCHHLQKKFEKELFLLKEEYDRKLAEIECKARQVEAQENGINEIRKIVEDECKMERDEIQRKKQFINAEEVNIKKRKREMEIAEIEMSREKDDLHSKIELFKIQQEEFFREKSNLVDLAVRVQKDLEKVNHYQRSHQSELEKLNTIKMEIDIKSSALNNEKFKIESEKSDLKNITKSLTSLRNEYLKDLNMKTSIPQRMENLDDYLTPRGQVGILKDKKAFNESNQQFFTHMKSPQKMGNFFGPHSGYKNEKADLSAMIQDVNIQLRRANQQIQKNQDFFENERYYMFQKNIN